MKILTFILKEKEYVMKLVPKNTDSVGVLSNNNMLVELDTNVTQELDFEGMARDIVRLIQHIRKEADLDVSNRINLNIQTTDKFIEKALNENLDYIKEQTLSSSFDLNKDINHVYKFNHELDSKNIVISFSVVK